ncbi:phage holin family protein [Neobacillus cucumis]|uniref:phage holin family protein n=1 Tax=Neobacillus cucumis TaxID=1740721 RepID=UPI00203ECFF6|nr:phage holin family protein [Neobacillus cucumis]MCM3725080.1 phage holin family protein [Neobacillus cucumis]
MTLTSKDYLCLLENNTAEDKVNEEIEECIAEALDSTRKLYWKIQEAKEKNFSTRNEYLGVLETALKYGEFASLELGFNGYKDTKNTMSSFARWMHKIFKPNPKAGYKMKPLFTALPLVRIEDIKNQWGNFIEVHTVKAAFAVLTAVFTLLFGSFNILSYVLIFMTVGHTLMRMLANKNKNQDDYIAVSRNIQLFLWPYFMLALGNTLSYVISFDGFPEGTFLSFFAGWIIWGEIKGLVENAEIAGFDFPPALKKLLKKSDDDDLPL